ncbi:MAG: hypothetical protein KF745_01175 [Phycisphaeraceae bacterium]|nr:hypothetical protein [Phycisphaeraceae bacterium]
MPRSAAPNRRPRIVVAALIIAAISAAAIAVLLSTVLRHAPVRTRPAPPAERAAGMNLEDFQYAPRQWPFTDAMRHAQPWATIDVDGGPPRRSGPDRAAITKIPCDADGYPLALPATVEGLAPQVVRTTMFYDTAGHYPAGRYTVLYEGSGDLEFYGDASVAAAEPGRVLLDVAPAAEGITLVIARSQAGNYIRNIRVLLPGSEPAAAGQQFHPLFLERLKPFKVLRFMEWQRTNGSTVKSWGDLLPDTYYTCNRPCGAPPSMMIDLCNALGASPWLCVPHLADDDYAAHLAALVRDRLEPGRAVYLEYSNETWNTALSQAQHLQRQGRARALAGDDRTAGARAMVDRATAVFAIFRRVLGDTHPLVCVLAGQAADPSLTREILAYATDRYGPDAFDAFAIGPYVGLDLEQASQRSAVAVMSPAQIFAALEEESSRVIERTQQHLDIAKRYGVPLLAYEGGQHLAGQYGAENDDRITSLFTAANRDERMGVLLGAYHRSWWAVGGGLFCAFNFTSPYNKWGSFGYLEYQDQRPDEAPKYRALLDAISPR